MKISTKLKYYLRDILRMHGYEILILGNSLTLESYIMYLNKKVNDLTFLQIGANDGKMNDPIYNIVNKLKIQGYVIEPVSKYYYELVNNYKDNKNVLPINCAIFEADTKLDMYIYEDPDSPEWTKGVASLDNNHFSKTNLNKKYLQKVKVEGIKFETLFNKYKIQKIDILVIDTEGYDYNLLKQFPFNKFKPRIIQFEHNISANVMKPEEFSEIITMLVKLNYKINSNMYDCIAYL